jgi:hypothetical protein
MNIAKKKIYDVCVIGSGAAGGFMVKELTAAGADTILIEAGGKGRLEDLYIHDWPYDLPKRGFGLFTQASLYGDDIGKAIEYRGNRIGVDRIRTLGGRTFHWNAVCLRFSADDFRERSLHGIEEDWPLSYEEVAPFYSHAERQMHVFGTREGLSQLPDGDFVAEAPRLRCSETVAQKRLARIGIKLIPVRKAVLLKSRKGRGPCHYCGHCMDVCDVRDHAYIPRFNQSRGKRDYVGGWGMQMNYVTWRWPHHAKSVEGFGSAYKKRVRELQTAMFQIGAWGKVEHGLQLQLCDKITFCPTIKGQRPHAIRLRNC